MVYFSQAAIFLVGVLFYLYILVVLLRFLLQWARADFYNPVSQFVVRATNPVLVPMRRVIPGVGGVDLAAVVLMLALKVTELVLVGALGGGMPGGAGLVFVALGELLNMAINLYIFTILVEVIISWVNPGLYNPVTALIYRLNEPLVRPARRLIPPMGGLDLSPLVVLIALQLAKILLVAPLLGAAGGGMRMM
jgi:YggT family protein